MRLRLDPWPADYEAPIAFEEAEAPAHARIDTTIETATWKAVAATAPPPAECCFVDGVRRVEARVIADVDGRLIHGLFGSSAAGFVRSIASAEFGEIRVERSLILGRGVQRGMRLRIGANHLVFDGIAAEQNTPNDVLGHLQNRMRAAEARLAEDLAGKGAFVFVDGLSYRATGRQEVIGVVKRIMEPYLAQQEFALLETLEPGERSPLFAIVDGNYDRYSCFLRLTKGRAVDHPLTGLVRLEVGAAVGRDKGVALMSAAAAVLPRFASNPIRDPRAPQNLLPVGALEQEMKRRLGDPLMIRRAIEKELHEQRDW
jgi:hypothetical protein